MRKAWIWLAVVIALARPAAADALRLYSYDPLDDETRTVAGPLTFEFRQGLFSLTLISVRATEAKATAFLKTAGERALGPGGLKPLIGEAPQRDLYEVLQGEEGAAMIAAFCPGAKRAWMAFGRPRLSRDLRVYVLGTSPQGGEVHVCHKLNFSFHGAWRSPPANKTPPPITVESPLPRY